MYRTLCLALAVVITSSQAFADNQRALILNDKDQQEYVQFLDMARRYIPLSEIPKIGHLIDKFQAAPVVTEHKEDPPATEAPKHE